jgi:hypothetical protein
MHLDKTAVVQYPFVYGICCVKHQSLHPKAGLVPRMAPSGRTGGGCLISVMIVANAWLSNGLVLLQNTATSHRESRIPNDR